MKRGSRGFRQLDETVRSIRKAERAKAILMQSSQIDESAASAYLRDQAMRRRVPIGAIAMLIVESSDMPAGGKE